MCDCLKRVTFYLIFYAGLSSFFSAMMAIFYQTLDMTAPKLQGSASLIGEQPVMLCRPNPPEFESEGPPMIRYPFGDSSESGNLYLRDLNEFLLEYRKNEGYSRVACNYNHRPSPGEVCEVDLMSIKPCGFEPGNISEPAYCIFLKLNKIYGWKPVVYSNSSDLPKTMPQNLQKYIKSLQDPKEMDIVWVTCEGVNPTDKENIGPIAYLPHQGFPGYFYPFTNQKGYLSPFVAVYFQQPQKGVSTDVDCKVWAKNIQHDRAKMKGTTRFTLFITP